MHRGEGRGWADLAQPDQAIDIPGIKSLLAGPDVVLLAHAPSLSQTAPSRREQDAPTCPTGKIVAVADVPSLTDLIWAIAHRDRKAAATHLNRSPHLAMASLGRDDEFFLAERLTQLYEGDTALHAAACSYDPEMATTLGIGRRTSEPAIDGEESHCMRPPSACPVRTVGTRRISGR